MFHATKYSCLKKQSQIVDAIHVIVSTIISVAIFETISSNTRESDNFCYQTCYTNPMNNLCLLIISCEYFSILLLPEWTFPSHVSSPSWCDWGTPQSSGHWTGEIQNALCQMLPSRCYLHWKVARMYVQLMYAASCISWPWGHSWTIARDKHWPTPKGTIPHQSIDEWCEQHQTWSS